MKRYCHIECSNLEIKWLHPDMLPKFVCNEYHTQLGTADGLVAVPEWASTCNGTIIVQPDTPPMEGEDDMNKSDWLENYESESWFNRLHVKLMSFHIKLAVMVENLFKKEEK